ncbi:MAG TPA: DUF2461 domain-containing protein [Bacteroidia bacterium]|nr:DUF2461 domain-containing protein [Bacteroidia bacterium]
MQKSLQFLRQLKKNNNREWFEENKALYLEAKSEFEDFVDALLKGICRFDKSMSHDLKAKDCVFRIYKDVRFSKDKSPYKTNMGASMNPGGKRSLLAGYYFHLSPGESFVAGGVYMPEPAVLQAIRQEIDYHPQPLLKTLKAASFKKHFKGFDEEDQLKTMPKGFDKDHPQAALLRNRHFVVSKVISDKTLGSKDLLKNSLEAYKAMLPLLQYLRAATSA